MILKNKIKLGVVVISIVLIFINICFKENIIITIFSAVLGSIIASIIISLWYNEEIIKIQSKYDIIGLKDYFNDFEDVQEKIRIDISTGTQVDIYVMYAQSFLNSSKKSISQLLSKKGSTLRLFIFSAENNYINSCGIHWGSDSKNYDAERIKEKVESVKKSIVQMYSDLPNPKGQLLLYEILNAPVNYSFYKIDKKLYYVPSKNTQSKNFQPPVFLFKDTKNINGQFAKVTQEIRNMLDSQELKKIEL